jgi:hypothetical protein
MSDLYSPVTVLREATRAVPAVKWALGVGGVFAGVALIYTFKINPRAAFVGLILMFLFMGVLVIFARASTLRSGVTIWPAMIFTWFVLIMFMATSISLFSSVFFSRPLDLQYWLTGSTAAVPETTKQVHELRYSQHQMFGHAVNGQHQVKDLCVQINADDDATIIAGSARIVTPVKNLDRGGQFSETSDDPKSYNPKRVCLTGDAHDDGTHGVNLTVCAFVVAEVLVRIPVGDTKSKYGDAPIYAIDPSQCK